MINVATTINFNMFVSSPTGNRCIIQELIFGLSKPKFTLSLPF